MRSDSTSQPVARMPGNPATQEVPPLPHRDPTLQEEGADLIDDTGTLADQTPSHPVQRLQVQLIGGLRGHELHRRALHRLGDRLRVAEVVLLPFE